MGCGGCGGERHREARPALREGGQGILFLR